MFDRDGNASWNDFYRELLARSAQLQELGREGGGGQDLQWIIKVMMGGHINDRLHISKYCLISSFFGSLANDAGIRAVSKPPSPASHRMPIQPTFSCRCWPSTGTKCPAEATTTSTRGSGTPDQCRLGGPLLTMEVVQVVPGRAASRRGGRLAGFRGAADLYRHLRVGGVHHRVRLQRLRRRG